MYTKCTQNKMVEGVWGGRRGGERCIPIALCVRVCSGNDVGVLQDPLPGEIEQKRGIRSGWIFFSRYVAKSFFFAFLCMYVLRACHGAFAIAGIEAKVASAPCLLRSVFRFCFPSCTS